MRRKKKSEPERAPLDPIPWFLARELDPETVEEPQAAPLVPVVYPAPKSVETRSYTQYCKDREEVLGPEALWTNLTYKEWAEYWAHASNQVRIP